MIQEVTMYTIKCDGDGCTADALDGSDYSAFSDPDNIWDYCYDSDWQIIDDKHYCPKHYELDDETDEYVPIETNAVTGG